jgi:hypothetical protein
MKTTSCNLKETVGKVISLVILAIFLSLPGRGIGEAAERIKHFTVSNKITSNHYQFCTITLDVSQIGYQINKGDLHTWDSTSCLKRISGTCYFEWPGNPLSAKTVYLKDYIISGSGGCESANYQVKLTGSILDDIAIMPD